MTGMNVLDISPPFAYVASAPFLRRLARAYTVSKHVLCQTGAVAIESCAYTDCC